MDLFRKVSAPFAAAALLVSVTSCSGPTPPSTEDTGSTTSADSRLLPGKPIKTPPTNLFNEEACLGAIAQKVAEWKKNGVSGDALERKYNEAVAACAGPAVDACTAAFIGSINFQYARLSEEVVQGLITPSDYVKAVRALARKLSLSRKDPSWCTAYQAGDQDDDSVPDDRDKCPGSPALTATDDFGCPLSPTERDAVAGPDGKLFTSLVNRVPLMVSDGCNGAPVPDVPKLISVARGFFPPFVQITATKVKNQPATCLIHYELVTRAWSTAPATPRETQDDVSQTTFRSIDDLTPGAATASFKINSNVENPCTSPICTQVLKYGYSQQPPGRQAFAVGASGHDKMEVRVRAVNGNGISSAWSTNTITVQ